MAATLDSEESIVRARQEAWDQVEEYLREQQEQQEQQEPPCHEEAPQVGMINIRIREEKKDGDEDGGVDGAAYKAEERDVADGAGEDFAREDRQRSYTCDECGGTLKFFCDNSDRELCEVLWMCSSCRMLWAHRYEVAAGTESWEALGLG